ncbi:hypothetical protein N9A94_02885 [Akkermansiaceae bacterium]|nr:hypothetical protein [Akkermansiaceae bacterium]MDB4537308.1 hypothetical protein [Akkermansiaceae bacterium]
MAELFDEQIAFEEGLPLIDREAKEEVNDAIEFTKSPRAPTIRELTEGLYWEVDMRSGASWQGRYFF